VTPRSPNPPKCHRFQAVAAPLSSAAAFLSICECVMPKTELDGLPVVEVPDSEEITVAVKADGLREADIKDAIATALRQQRGVDDARVSKREVLIRRGDQWFRYGAPKRVSSRE